MCSPRLRRMTPSIVALAMADAHCRCKAAKPTRCEPAQRAVKSAHHARDAYVAIGLAWMRLARATHDEGYVLHAAAAAHLALSRAPSYTPAVDLLAATRLSAHDFADAARLHEPGRWRATRMMRRRWQSCRTRISKCTSSPSRRRQAISLLAPFERSLLSLPRIAHLAHLRGDDATAIRDYDEALAIATPNEAALSLPVDRGRA